MKEKKVRIPYMVGTMIEVPRGALTAGEIAQTAQFFSFGTNDLTQMTLGMSRDDSGKFLPAYQNAEIVSGNPFASIDQTGVGKLIRMAATSGRETRPDIKLGICGEHGGDPASVKFCNSLGLTYVSCSPYRVPTARLAAAQAALEQEECCCCCGKGDKCCKNDGKAKTAKVASKAAKASAPVKAAKTAKKAAKKPAKKTAKK
jgi:pyruvate,orthophosphate dikinase